MRSSKRARAGIEVEKPKAFQLRSVRIDLKKLFAKLGEAAAHSALATAGHGDSVAKLAGAAVGSVEAFSIATPIEVRAWRLIHGAFARALGELTEELLAAGRVYTGDVKRLTNAA